MTQRLPAHAIDDLAAEWAAKVDSGSLLPEEDAALDAWLSADARHLGAFAKARAVTLRMDRARALGVDFDPAKFGSSATHEPEEPAGHSRRHMMAMSAMAASATAIAVASGILWRAFGRQTFSTQIGETRVVPLEDGSVVTLNTDSEVSVNYTAKRRDIRLLRGEALFDVAKNKQRPFIVEAGDTLVRAVGTSFTVSLLPDRPIQVLVREGVVEIKRPEVRSAPAIRASANIRVLAPAGSPIVVKPLAAAEVKRALVWQVGRIAFEGETLHQAAEDFARYSEIRIIIDDPAIANETITGLFVSNDPVGFTKAVALSLNLRAEVGEGEVHLVR